ncbi:hypothetical protein Gpo141_00011489 [Globisporangium polare]
MSHSQHSQQQQQQPELSFGLALAARKDSGAEQEECKFDDVMALQEEAIQVKFLLPDDSTITHEFKKGHTVTVLKCFLEEELELQQHNTQLFLENRLMLDPFSLTDFKCVLSARSIEIEVRQVAGSASITDDPSPAARK